MPHDSPYFVQTNEGPLFVGQLEIDTRFCCAKCGNVLIENYIESDFLGVGIQCFHCETISTTPLDLNGEVFSVHTITIDEVDGYKLEGPIKTWPDVVIACEPALLTQIERMTPGEPLPFEFSAEWLDGAVARYNEISRNAFELQSKIVAKTGDREALKFPFAWAVGYLRSCFEAGTMNIDRVESSAAMTFLRMFCDAVGAWQHHPRFATVAFGIGEPDKFLHTTAQMIAAKYFFQNNLPLGLSLEDQHGQPNPDLYLRGLQSGRFYFEVKAPKTLQSFNSIPRDLRFVKSKIDKVISASAGQINRSRPGVLIVYSSLFNPSASGEIERVVQQWLRSNGRRRKALAGVISASMRNMDIRRRGADVQHGMQIAFSPILNPHFEGDNPLVIGVARPPVRSFQARRSPIV